MITPLITVEGITVRLRDRWLLNGSSWCINSGEQWAVIGPNGAGKTTLAKAIGGLLPVVQGKIHYHAFEDVTPQDAIAYVASDARRDLWRRERHLDHARGFAGRLHETTRVRALIVPKPSDVPARICERRLADLSRQLDLEALLDKPLMAISTGEMSRVLIVRELVRRPKMLILDEPFEGLDLPGRHDLMVMLDRLAMEGLPIVLITHRAEEMLAATTHVLTVDAGRITSAVPIAYFRESMVVPPAPKRDQRQQSCLQTPISPGRSTPPSGNLALIDMRAVTVRYGETTVLDQLTWTVGEGEHWAVTGPNGAGKSTLLKLITGDCLQVYANRVHLFGKDRTAGQTLGEVRKRLGVVSHELASSYQKQMSAMDVVCSGFFDSVGLYRHCDSEQKKTAAGWLAETGMSPLSRLPFNQLSQGQRQMVLIARAMVKTPTLLILDEPCAGLDPENRRTILDLVQHIGRCGGTGLVFVTHHENEIPDCITHRLVLDRGRIGRIGVVDGG